MNITKLMQQYMNDKISCETYLNELHYIRPALPSWLYFDSVEDVFSAYLCYHINIAELILIFVADDRFKTELRPYVHFQIAEERRQASELELETILNESDYEEEPEDVTDSDEEPEFDDEYVDIPSDDEEDVDDDDEGPQPDDEPYFNFLQQMTPAITAIPIASYC